jgi:hypothetical protein
MTSGFKWYGDKFVDDLEREYEKRLVKSAVTWTTAAKHNLSKGGTSTPGTYPAKKSGELMRSVKYKINKRTFEAAMGTDVPHGKFLQEGTKNLSKRPWMTLTNRKAFPKIKKIMEEKL